MEVNMLKTPIGTLDILLNGERSDYIFTKLNTCERNFSVEGRYKVIVNIPISRSQDIAIECKLIDFVGDNAKGNIESGEKLALISFYHDNIKLSVGTEDEIKGVSSSYIDYGLKVIISKTAIIQHIAFGLAWIDMKDREIEDIYTWFAADPTLW